MASVALIIDSLHKRGIDLTSHEVNIAILYSRLDSVYYRHECGKIDRDAAAKEIADAIESYRKYETPNASIDSL